MNNDELQLFSRAALFLGEEKLEKISNSTVTVVGLGAVGSFLIESLVRTGVRHFRLFDFDEIRPSNINRQLFATQETLGKLKVEAARERILSINKNAHVEIFPLFVGEDSMETLLGAKSSDLYVDAIDSVNPKTQLLFTLHKEGKKMISSMGAGRKNDPTLIRFGDISKTKECLLARHIRQRLRRRGVEKGIPCVYSLEKPINSLSEELSFEVEKGDDFKRGRPRESLASLCHMTGIFGLTMAKYSIDILLS